MHLSAAGRTKGRPRKRFKRIMKNNVKYMKQDIDTLKELNSAEDNAIFSSIDDNQLAGKRANDLEFIKHMPKQ